MTISCHIMDVRRRTVDDVFALNLLRDANLFLYHPPLGKTMTFPINSQQDPISSLGVLQLRCLLRALGLPTDGLRSTLARRVREARASGALVRFVEEEKRAAPSGCPQCREFLVLRSLKCHVAATAASAAVVVMGVAVLLVAVRLGLALSIFSRTCSNLSRSLMLGWMSAV